MDQQQIEETLKILKSYNDLLNISSEIKNRIPEKNHEAINDLVIEIEDIADKLMHLENDMYLLYLDNIMLEKEW